MTHGFGRYTYAQTFFNEKITMDVMTMLTKQEMAELGVKIGHRKKLEK